MARVIPLHLDAVACFGINGLDCRAVGRWHVARHVVACYIFDGRVGGRHPDPNLVAGRGVVDPDLVEVLVGGDGADERRG